MSYIEINTKVYPLTAAEIMHRNPACSFPVPFALPDGYAEVQEAEPPAFDAATHELREKAPKNVSSNWVQQWELIARTPEQIGSALDAERQALAERVTSARWQRETGGISFPDGTRVGTSIDDQNRITSVIANAQLAGVTSVDFKAASGWVTLTLDEVRGIAAAIAVHVQDCFSAERAHHDAIDALQSLEQLRGYDVSAGWPA